MAVRGGTPKPPDTVTITAPIVLPIPVITSETMRDTPGLIASPLPSSSSLGVGLGTLPEYLVYAEPDLTIEGVPITVVERVGKDPRATLSVTIVVLSVYTGVSLFLRPFT